MGEKGLLLAFISDFKEKAETAGYRVKDDNGTERWFEGTQTNDAPIKYLIVRALEDHHKIEKIICIVSQKVQGKGYKEFKEMVSDYIDSSEELREAYKGQGPEFYQVDYPELEEISARASEVYRQLAAPGCIGGEAGASVYIDHTGGPRDTNFLMSAIIRYLEYYGVSCREIVYSSLNRDDKSKNTIYSLRCIYDMYQLLNGVEQFVTTGNAELLQACYRNEGDTGTNELLEQIVRFSHAMSLCDVGDVDEIMKQLRESLDRFDALEDKGGFFSVMFGDLTSIIRKKLYIERGRDYTYPRLIQWCLDNNMVQQALTLYIEKMPEFYCDQGLFTFTEEDAERSRKNKNNKGLEPNWRTEYFYGPFYDQLIMPELENFRRRLKDGYDVMKNTYPDPSKVGELKAREFRQLKKYMETDEEKKAVDRLVGVLRRYYEEAPSREIVRPYSGKKMDNRPADPNGLAKVVINNDKEWLIYLLYNNKEKYEQYEEIYSGVNEKKTYKKKVFALDAARSWEGKLPMTGTEDKELIYEIMKYYLALKLLRNRINHASEQEAQEDERKAIDRLEKDHGLCMKIQFENVKNLLQAGIGLCLDNAEKQQSKALSVKKDLKNTISTMRGGEAK